MNPKTPDLLKLQKVSFWF